MLDFPNLFACQFTPEVCHVLPRHTLELFVSPLPKTAAFFVSGRKSHRQSQPAAQTGSLPCGKSQCKEDHWPWSARWASQGLRWQTYRGDGGTWPGGQASWHLLKTT